MSEILEKLSGGDRRSIGRSEEVVRDVLAEPGLFKDLFEGMLHSNQLVRWHFAQLAPRLAVNPLERQELAEILTGFLEDNSRIVKTFAMQALADLAMQDSPLRQRVIPLLEDLVKAGSPAMRSRGMKLLKKLRRNDL